MGTLMFTRSFLLIGERSYTFKLTGILDLYTFSSQQEAQFMSMNTTLVLCATMSPWNRPLFILKHQLLSCSQNLGQSPGDQGLWTFHDTLCPLASHCSRSLVHLVMCVTSWLTNLLLRTSTLDSTCNLPSWLPGRQLLYTTDWKHCSLCCVFSRFAMHSHRVCPWHHTHTQ